MPQAPLDKLYWIAAGEKKIQRANLDGSDVEDIVSGLSIPLGLAIDPDGERIYWIDIGTKKIQRACHDGSRQEDVLSDLEGPSALAIGPLKIYWVDRKLKQILCANLNGSRVDVLVSDLKHPNAIGLDTSAGKIYWGDYGTMKIHRASLDGSNAETIVPYGKNSSGIAVDGLHGKIFWANFGTKAIYRSSLNGYDLEPIMTGLENPHAIAVTPTARLVYWVDRDERKIRRAALDGSGAEDVVCDIKDPWGVVLGRESPASTKSSAAELSVKIMLKDTGAAPLKMLLGLESTGQTLRQRVLDVIRVPPGKEQLVFFTNPGSERRLLTEPWKTLQALGLEDGAVIEAETAQKDRPPLMAVRQQQAPPREPPREPPRDTPQAAAPLHNGRQESTSTAAPEDDGVREIKKYSWCDEGSSVKIYITEASNAEAIAAAKDGKSGQVKAEFNATSLSLTVHGESRRFVLALRGLFREVVPEKCKFRVSEGKRITMTLTKKAQQESWSKLSEKM